MSFAQVILQAGNILLSELMLSDEQLVALRLIDVTIFCDSAIDIDFGRREIITCLARLDLEGRVFLVEENKPRVGGPRFRKVNQPQDVGPEARKYEQRLDAVMTLICENADRDISLVLLALLIRWRTHFRGLRLASMGKIMNYAVVSGRYRDPAWLDNMEKLVKIADEMGYRSMSNDA